MMTMEPVFETGDYVYTRTPRGALLTYHVRRDGCLLLVEVQAPEPALFGQTRTPQPGPRRRDEPGA
jgi:hypothetical protein